MGSCERRACSTILLFSEYSFERGSCDIIIYTRVFCLAAKKHAARDEWIVCIHKELMYKT